MIRRELLFSTLFLFSFIVYLVADGVLGFLCFCALTLFLVLLQNWLLLVLCWNPLLVLCWNPCCICCCSCCCHSGSGKVVDVVVIVAVFGGAGSGGVPSRQFAALRKCIWYTSVASCMYRQNKLLDPTDGTCGSQGAWFRTGDLAVQHPGGRVELKDRAKDIIIRYERDSYVSRWYPQYFRHFFFDNSTATYLPVSRGITQIPPTPCG